jgi:uncharacterized protein (TIGR02611 family)
MNSLKHNGKRIVLEGLGWLLIIIGLAALVLPGPGLLALFAGLALLSTQYEWAERRLEPVRSAAFKTAADSVKSRPRITLSVSLALMLVVAGIVWGLRPATPSWWPLSDKFWLIGGWGTGGTLIASGLIAVGMIIYSYFHFREASKTRKA